MKKPAKGNKGANDQQQKLMELLKQKQQKQGGGFNAKGSADDTASGKPPRGVKLQVWNRKSGM